MTLLNLSPIEIKFADFSYTVEELVDEILKERLDEDVRTIARNDLKIERVYKAFDLRKIDLKNTAYTPPAQNLNDMFVEVGQKLLQRLNKDPNEIGLLITISDYHQYLSPSPTVEIVERLGLNKYVRTQNLQGLACSSFPEALRNAAGHFALGYPGEVLIMNGAFYLDWFLDSLKQIDYVSLKNKKDFHDFIYFLILSDVTAGILVSNGPPNDSTLAQLETEAIFSRKDIAPEGYKDQTIRMTPNDSHRITFEMNVNTKLLQEKVADFSQDNITRLKEKFPKEFEKIKSWGFHTAGARYVDKVREKCQIDKGKTKLTYDIMRETGNTGSVSSLQFIKEAIDRGDLKKEDYGGFVDYGWEGADSFIFKAV